MEDFWKRFHLSNQKQTETKKPIIEAINELINNKLIQSQFKILKKDKSVIQNIKLTSLLITQTRVISLEIIVR